MKTAYIFIAEGFEEMEAVTPVDLLRRVGMDAKLVSVTGNKTVTGAHGVPYLADVLFEDIDAASADALVLPGGMPGTLNLKAHAGLAEALKAGAAAGKYICAICAAPMVLGGLGLLAGKKATIYPGMEEHLTGAMPEAIPVVTDGKTVTSRAPGTAIPFALKLAELLAGKEAAEALKKDIVF